MRRGEAEKLVLLGTLRPFSASFLPVNRLFMKPDCQQVLTQFASFSVEELSDSEAASLLLHLEECEPCKGQWLLFEKTLTVVTQSGPLDQDVEQHRSQQMWLVCMEHARQNAQKNPALVAHSQNMETQPAKSDLPNEDSPTSTASRVGMTIVGGALLMIASSSWLAPHAATADVATPAKSQIGARKTTLHAVAPSVDCDSTLGFQASYVTSLISAPTKNLVCAAIYKTR